MENYEVIFGALIVVLLLSIRAKAAFIIEQNIEQRKITGTTVDEVLRRIEAMIYLFDKQDKQVIQRILPLFNEIEELHRDSQGKLDAIDDSLDWLTDATTSKGESILEEIKDSTKRILEDLQHNKDETSEQVSSINEEINEMEAEISNRVTKDLEHATKTTNKTISDIGDDIRYHIRKLNEIGDETRNNTRSVLFAINRP